MIEKTNNKLHIFISNSGKIPPFRGCECPIFRHKFGPTQPLNEPANEFAGERDQKNILLKTMVNFRLVTGPSRRHMTFGWGVCHRQTSTAEFKLP